MAIILVTGSSTGIGYGVAKHLAEILPSMREHKDGCIINIISVAGKIYGDFQSTYCSSKAALEAFREASARK